MFIGFVQFPAVKPGQEEKFREWFFWSNSHFESQPGFISRRLIRVCGAQNEYAAIIEFDSLDNFTAVGNQPFHAESAQRLALLLEGMPVPKLYEELKET